MRQPGDLFMFSFYSSHFKEAKDEHTYSTLCKLLLIVSCCRNVNILVNIRLWWGGILGQCPTGRQNLSTLISATCSRLIFSWMECCNLFLNVQENTFEFKTPGTVLAFSCIGSTASDVNGHANLSLIFNSMSRNGGIGNLRYVDKIQVRNTTRYYIQGGPERKGAPTLEEWYLGVYCS